MIGEVSGLAPPPSAYACGWKQYFMQKQKCWDECNVSRVLQLSRFVCVRGSDLNEEEVTQLHLQTGPMLFSSTIFVANVSGFSFAWLI